MKRSWAISAVSVAVFGVGLFILLGDRGDSGSLRFDGPRIVSVSELEELAAEDAGVPIYWLGARKGSRYELSETADGGYSVAYLQAGGRRGERPAEYVTVASYPSDDGVAALRRAARNRPRSKLGRTDGGAILLIDPGSPRNAHLAYPGGDFQVEVFSPVPGEALRLAARGDTRPVR